ncbi:MAG: alpha-amylase family glycosyl hydrolase [Saprospiraceae bacterium]|nr:alpha-amylase family glycosyl hydrolase [Saprospiraceae bacterium]
MKYLTFFLFAILFSSAISAQIVSIDPVFPKRTETVTITYDATQGNGGLAGENQVYMHTGLITNTSNSGSDWKFVVGNWGTDDPRVKMTNIGNDKHTLSFVIDEFYNVPNDVEIEKLAFVFRNVNGSKEGKTAQNQDIFLDFVNTDGFAAQLISPTQTNIIANLGDEISIKYATSEVSEIELTDNEISIFQETTDYIEYMYTVSEIGDHTIRIVASLNNETLESSFSITVNPEIVVEALPQGALPGINKIGPDRTRLVLMAPQKNNAYVLGDFNDWTISTDYFMKQTPDGSYFWIDIEGLDENTNYAFQYLVDGTIFIADPFSEIVLDKNNDPFISEATFPNMHPYPAAADGYVSLMKTGAEDYQWQHDFVSPAKENLVIYELLMRDFTNEKNYQTLLDTLDYLDRLGINALQFMPINEFEGNESWGYNPSFHMALDKYYGTPTAFKTVVDECHRRGIAVILDVVYNHAFSQSPFAQLYWDAANFRPSSDSPFLNPIAKHPFNVGYDFNHESEFTKAFVNRVTRYWIEEYHIDGFRFDLSKGFTQKESNNDGVFAAYDATRINILQDYADNIWDVNSDVYVILEHFASNSEEKVLSNYGMMLWSNHNHSFNEGTLGFNTNEASNFEWIDYKRKGWNDPHAVGYMESHDEERLMYKNLNFGNSSSSYNVKDLTTALERIELASAFLYMIPGPKMLWQFGELGYDFSINRCTNGSINPDCRLSPKPIRWDYKEDLQRKQLYDVTAALIKLKTEYDLTKTTTYAHSLADGKKYIRLSSDDLNAIVVGNFEIGARSLSPGFQHKGWWYDYITGDSLNVENQLMNIVLNAGEYRVYLDEKIGDPTIISGIEDPKEIVQDYLIFPNPAQSLLSLKLTLSESQEVKSSIYTANGKVVKSDSYRLGSGDKMIQFDIDDLPPGLYYLNLQSSSWNLTDRFIKNE